MKLDCPDIFDYIDFPSYLLELSKYLKQEKQFNLRAFAKRAGLKSPGFLKMVIEGRRKITLETAKGFCEALDIHGRERAYFLKLVVYKQEADPDLKKKYLNKIFSLRPRSSHFLLEKQHNRYFSEPYYVCIREMVALQDFQEDSKWIAGRCLPKIAPSQAAEAIATLLHLGLLKRNEQGKLMQSEGFIRTEDSIQSGIETYHYHEAVLDKARHALGILPQQERNYYALTLPLPKELYQEMVQDLYALRDRFVKKLESVAKEKPLEEVYQINFQIFPLTKRRES